VAFTGGLLGMVGNLVVVWGRQMAQRAQKERETILRTREDEIRTVLDFLARLRRLFLRLKMYQRVQGNAVPSESLIPSIDEISPLLKDVPAPPIWLYKYGNLWQQLDELISEGVDLLLSEVDEVSVDSIERWEEESRVVIEKITHVMREV